MTIGQSMLGEFDQEMQNTRKTLERVPDEKWNWKPHDKSGTLGWLAGHIATLPGWITMTINTEELDYAPVNGPSYQPPKTDNRKEVLAVFDKESAEARAALESLVKDSYAWFKGLVQDRRHLSDGELQTVSDGRVFTGHQAIGLKLVDELGDERAALAWLAKEKNIDAKLPVRDYQLHDRFRDLPFLHAMAVATLDAAGLGALARHVDDWGAIQAVERLNLDGLLALWHPTGAE